MPGARKRRATRPGGGNPFPPLIEIAPIVRTQPCLVRLVPLAQIDQRKRVIFHLYRQSMAGRGAAQCRELG